MRLDGIDPRKKKAIFIAVGGVILVLAIVSIILVATPAGRDLAEGGAEYASDREFDEDANEYWEKYPIISYLPIIENTYRIDYGECETSEDEFCIMISANTQAARERALRDLYNAESNFSGKYKIEYFEYEQ